MKYLAPSQHIRLAMAARDARQAVGEGRNSGAFLFPGSAARRISIARGPAGWVCSTMTMASAPRGNGPPVAIEVAVCGIAEISVARKPRVAVISTGDELVQPGEQLKR